MFGGMQQRMAVQQGPLKTQRTEAIVSEVKMQQDQLNKAFKSCYDRCGI